MEVPFDHLEQNMATHDNQIQNIKALQPAQKNDFAMPHINVDFNQV